MMLLAFVLLFLSSVVGHAATVYVAKTGDDTRTCEQAKNQTTPRKTIQQGITCLVGADTLVIDDGVYSEQLSDYDDREHPGAKRPPNGLSWSQPTTIKAANPRQVTLNKPGVGDPYNHVVFFGRPDTQYISIEGLVIDSRGHGTCVWLGPGNHLRLKDNVIKNCSGNGVYGAVADDKSGGQDLQVIGNEIFNIAVGKTGPPGSHAIYWTANHGLIRGNYVHTPCPFYGIHASSELGGLHDNVIENNRVTGCGQAGIMNQGGKSVIRNNLAESNGIGIQCNGSGDQSVSNNTIFGWADTEHNGNNNYGILDLSSGCRITNNLVLQQRDQSSTPRYIYSTGGASQRVGNMCDGQYAQNCQIRVPDYRAVIVDGPGGALTLTSTSPAINAGASVTDVPTDRVGVTRPQGSGFDIGAYEYTTVPPPIDPPPSGADTTKPQATLTSPLAGAEVSGSVMLTATATDNVGIAGLQFQVDNKNVGPEITQPPYQYSWQTTTPGIHTVTVSVRDTASNFGKSSPVSITVVDSPIPPVIPPVPGAVLCSGTISAVPGPISLRCVGE